jgi:hypothetical protein
VERNDLTNQIGRLRPAAGGRRKLVIGNQVTSGDGIQERKLEGDAGGVSQTSRSQNGQIHAQKTIHTRGTEDVERAQDRGRGDSFAITEGDILARNDLSGH